MKRHFDSNQKVFLEGSLKGPILLGTADRGMNTADKCHAPMELIF
jgi:hypothetical protein